MASLARSVFALCRRKTRKIAARQAGAVAIAAERCMEDLLGGPGA